MISFDPSLLADIQKGQLWLLAGFVLLGWVMARRQVRLRKRVHDETRVAHRELDKIRNHREIAVPLCDAPPETQRWQAALFDLQRELKAELDTRIMVVQTLLRQVDQRIETLQSMDAAATVRQSIVGQQQTAIADLVRGGHTAPEIAARTGLPIGDIELAIATFHQV
jgi:hypothetical protein